VPDEIRDGFEGNTVAAHQGHERVAQLPRRPVLAETGLLGDRFEGPANVGCIQRCPRLAGEDEAVIPPALSTWAAA
jgi:hypothetical protein